MKEQARGQDFLALFNMTVGTKKTLTELSTNVNNRLNNVWLNQTAAIAAIENNVTSQLQSFEINQNKTVMRFENMVRGVERSANGSHDLLQRQINISSEKGYFIFIFIISLNERVIAYSCENDNCKAAIDLPLITKLNAPLKAELDISGLTTQLKELIGNEAKQAVSVAMKDLAEIIVEKRTQVALENLQTYNNRTISTFLQEMEVKMEANHNITVKEIHSLNIVDFKLEKMIEQTNENQIKQISSIESALTKNNERVAMTAFLASEAL